ncbi:PBSX family phage terminase large subunit [Clostridium sp.]|uniref:PBSX family phage terminase large subunit n=1 Tax=Clostridium sp. TaxID=1506 RepID=UPI001A4082AD|nr:PBSX family phage terminase large subunit [Clostridium sp.]MBK5234030.1 PBSX family phage terminase large subunit [Clostridium sp.]
MVNEQTEVTTEVKLKVNNHFMEFVNDWDYRTYLLIGAYGSSKSYEAATKIILKLLNEKRKCLVVRNTYEQIKESCYDLMYEIMDGIGIITEDRTAGNDTRYVIAYKSPLEFRFPNGSRIIFKGMDRPSKVKSINGVTLVWIEEAAEVSYPAFKELNLRLRNPNLAIYYILTSNPIERSNWVFTYYFERIEITSSGKEKRVEIINEEDFYNNRVIKNKKNNTYYHHSIPEDNAFITNEYIQELDDLKKYDPDLWRVARLGRFGVNGTKVLPQLVIAKNATKFREAVSRSNIKRNGMDFGFETSFNAIIRCAVDLDKSYLFIYDEYYRNKMTDKETAEKLPDWNTDVRNMLVKCDSAEPKTIKFYRDEGFMFKATKKVSRIQQIKKIKRFKRIIVSPKCKNVIRELKDLVYKEDSNGNKIYDEFNIDPHTFSAIWYALDDISVANVKERKSNSIKGG